MRFTAETRGCLKCKFRPGLHEWVDVSTDVPRTDNFVRTKISWMRRLPNFLTTWNSAIKTDDVTCCIKSTWIRTGLLRGMVHESVHTKMLKFVFLPSVSSGSAFYGQIWLFDASCWISLKNEYLLDCACKTGIICFLQWSYISKIFPIILLGFVNYAHFGKKCRNYTSTFTLHLLKDFNNYATNKHNYPIYS